MAFILTAVCDNSRPSWIGGYKFAMTQNDSPITERLVQSAPVENNRLHLRGAFATREAALRAAIDCVGAPCKILSVRPWGEDIERLVVQAHSDRADFAHADVSVAASRSERGVFVAA